MTNKKFLQIVFTAFGAAIVILIILALARKGNMNHQASNNSSNNGASSQQTGPTSTQSSISTLSLSNKDLALALPANFPTEAGSRVLQDLQITDSQAKTVKILRTTTTAKQPADNLKIYSAWMAKYNWTVTGNIDVPTFKSVSAKNGQQTLTVNFSYDGGSKSNVVIVTYVKPE